MGRERDGRCRTWRSSSSAPVYTAEVVDDLEGVIEARIYAGIHYRTSDEDGAAVGCNIARFVVNHTLRVGTSLVYLRSRYVLMSRGGDLVLDRVIW